jgi:hypothetical protein
MKKRKEKDINRLFNLLGWHPNPVESIRDAEEESEKSKRVPAAKSSGICGKSSYTSERTAKQAMRNRLNKGANVSRLRCYRCEKCGLWHMTSSFRG